MSAEVFDTVFDVAASGLPSLGLAAFGAGLGAVVTIALYLARRPGWYFGILFSLGFVVLIGTAAWLPYLELRDAVAAGRCAWVKGEVRDYVAEPYTGHSSHQEQFTVAGRRFQFSNFQLGAGFQRTVAYGGVHLAGRTVRLCLIDGLIVRVDVRRDAWPAQVSLVHFRIKSDVVVEFSTAFYGVTQSTRVRSYPAIWAKDFGISDFDVAIAGSCNGAIRELEALVSNAAKSMDKQTDALATYSATAKCTSSPVPPLRSRKPPPPVRLYGGDGAWSSAVWD